MPYPFGVPAKLKGSVLRATLDWYREQHGEQEYDRLFEGLADDDRRLAHEDILPNVWYDVRVAHELLDRVFLPLLPAERHRVARDAARAGLAVLSRGLYKFILEQVVSPELYARHIQRLFRMLHDTGERRIELGDHEGLSITARWAGHHPLLCLLVNETTAAVFESLGCKDVTVERLSCVSEGAPDCRCRLRWR